MRKQVAIERLKQLEIEVATFRRSLQGAEERARTAEERLMFAQRDLDRLQRLEAAVAAQRAKIADAQNVLSQPLLIG